MIIGASGHGKVVADIAIKMGEWGYIAFIDDNNNMNTSLGLEVIDNINNIDTYIKDYDVFVGIGDNIVREKIQTKVKHLGANIPILIHPNATIGADVKIDIGTVIMSGVSINCCSNIGQGCIINTGSTIDHDSHIEEFVHVSPGVNLAGNVKVGKRSWLGIGSIVSNNIDITNDCKVGAGSVVVKNITEPDVYVGVPVRRITK
nr:MULTISPECIES: acetyltransferase [unclassified Exiguobacterium]